MRVYIPDMPAFFRWMDERGHRYAVLRSFEGFDKGYPAVGGKEDVDLLVDDGAQEEILALYGSYKRSFGVKCDIYNVTGAGSGSYLGGSYYPPALARKVLDERRKWKDLFYVPSAQAHLLSLMYHVAYHKAELSKISLDDSAQSSESKYVPAFDRLFLETGISVPHTLLDYHGFLQTQGFSIDDDAFARFSQNQFARQWKGVGMFLCRVAAERKGEMNLFVIRRVATKTDTHKALLRFLGKHYKLIAVKPVSLKARITEAYKMRGGKWRRGGWPVVAVVVYDANPHPTTAEERKVHPWVLNARQFKKREWREWFTKQTGMKPSANPIHSTDNEAEAIAHLPLFFDTAEQEKIFARLRALRGGGDA